MSFWIRLCTGGDACDKCHQPMDELHPGMEITSSTRENGQSCVWVHLSCFEKEFKKINFS